MDIEVAEQLFPNLLTIITQLCATGVLLFFAAKFLWEPGREMLAKRQELMQSRLDDAERTRAEAADDRAAAQAELRDTQARAKNLIETARAEASQERERILDEASREADDMRDKATAAIERERAEMRADIQREIVDVALAASTKLMGKDELREQDERALEAFVRELEDESGR